MSYIPTQTLNMSLFSLETSFDSVPGTQDPTYNPLIVDGLEIHGFLDRQTHISGKYIEGITVDPTGIYLPQGYSYILDPYIYYSSGTTYQPSPYFSWIIDGVEDTTLKFASHYATDVGVSAPNTATGRGYRGLKYIDCSSASKVIKLKAQGVWSSMGNVYFDNQQTNAVLTSTHKSHILVYAIPSADITTPSITSLDMSFTSLGTSGSYSTNAFFLGATLQTIQLPTEALNKYCIYNPPSTPTPANDTNYRTPTNPSVGDFIGLMIARGAVSTTAAVSCVSPAQTLLTATSASNTNTCYMWQWTGIRWVEIPFSTFGLVKIP